MKKIIILVSAFACLSTGKIYAQEKTNSASGQHEGNKNAAERQKNTSVTENGEQVLPDKGKNPAERQRNPNYKEPATVKKEENGERVKNPEE